ncbi:phosphoadenosine phosphosulfate reductase domain-containing protein [Sphingomonas melonis]|uniref:phosphoadenosine phosphosulfate reductase domain-containing protein n=1 Tax=Sphingomonas melonis TaxID=152682 RepID=UPI0035C7A991
MTLPDRIKALVERGALFVINDSGGKDSQAMKVMLKRLIPHAQLLIVHAVLPEVEWDGSIEHIERYSAGIPIIEAHACKTFWQMVDHRGMFPSPANRQCTSDLKTGPITREIRRYLAAHPEFGGLVVNCMGMRAAESPKRSKLIDFKRNERNSVAGREWYDWLPIHHFSTEHVFQLLAAAGEEPFWTYAAGMSRKSCIICIMSSKDDLTRAAELQPQVYARYCHKEIELGFTVSMTGKRLPEITGIEPLPLAA